MNERPTPESDAAEIYQTFHSIPPVKTGRVTVDFARRLERQRDELLEVLQSFPGFTKDDMIQLLWMQRCIDAIAAVREGKES